MKNQPLKGTYLKHIKYSFRVDLSQTKALKFIKYIVKQIEMTSVLVKIIKMPPGFDIFCILKESHIALSYWKEVGLCIMDIFSCKNFVDEVISDHIKRILNVDKVIERKIMDKSVIEEVRRLGG